MAPIVPKNEKNISCLLPIKALWCKNHKKSNLSQISHVGTVKSLLLLYCTVYNTVMLSLTLERKHFGGFPSPLPSTPSRKRNEE
jgi:hypothetical protein